MPILLFLKSLDIKSWIIIALSTVILGLWTMNMFQKVQVGLLKNEVDKMEIVVQTYKNNVNILTDAVKEQNNAIATLADRNKEFAGVLEGATAQNQRVATEAEKLIAALKKSFVPKDCDGATKHLNEFTQDFGKTWNKKGQP